MDSSQPPQHYLQLLGLLGEQEGENVREVVGNSTYGDWEDLGMIKEINISSSISAFLRWKHMA